MLAAGGVAARHAAADAARIHNPMRLRAPPVVVHGPPGPGLAVPFARSLAGGYFELAVKGAGASIRRTALALPGNSALRQHGDNGHHLSLLPEVTFVGAREVDCAAGHVNARARPDMRAAAVHPRPAGALALGVPLPATYPPGVQFDAPGARATMPPPGNWPAHPDTGRLFCGGGQSPRQCLAMLHCLSYFTEVQHRHPGVALMPMYGSFNIDVRRCQNGDASHAMHLVHEAMNGLLLPAAAGGNGAVYGLLSSVADNREARKAAWYVLAPLARPPRPTPPRPPRPLCPPFPPSLKSPRSPPFTPSPLPLPSLPTLSPLPPFHRPSPGTPRRQERAGERSSSTARARTCPRTSSTST